MIRYLPILLLAAQCHAQFALDLFDYPIMQPVVESGGGGYAIEDTFTEASDTGLESHTPESGGAWSGEQTTSITVFGSEDEARGDSSAIYWSLNQQTVATNNTTEARFRLYTNNSSGRAGVITRYTDGDNFDTAWVNGAGVLWLYSRSGGSWGTGRSYSIAGFNNSSYYDLKVTHSGTNLIAHIDGVERQNIISLNDGGKSGLYFSTTNGAVTTFTVTE